MPSFRKINPVRNIKTSKNKISNGVNLTFWTAIIALLFCCPFSLSALPEVDNVAEGEVQFETPDTSTLQITTLTDRAVINYRQFNIAQNETVHFIQPSAFSSVLNRDLGNTVSQILGNLFANGSIILINPQGINIGPTANINVASIIASTLNISDADFLSGKYNFFKAGENAFILNQGNIIIRNGGYVALLSGAVENTGTIVAQLGTVVLASGEKMTLALDDLNQISVVIDEAVKTGVLGFDSAIKNTGTISANGGKVILTAKVLNNVFDYAINNSGIIEAKSLENHNGVVELVAEGAPIYNIGKIEAGEVRIQTDSDFINTGELITDGYEGLPNGGRISIEAETILQAGTISANANEEGTAGEIIIVSDTSTTLDSGSTTEARALGLVGNGGRILIDSLSGNTVVNTLAVIDVSAGAISGNAGFIEISAFEQLGFYGVLNGRAPPGFSSADILLKTNLPYDPSLLDLYALIIDAEVTSGNIFIFTNQRLSISGSLTAQDTIQVDSQGADISGTIKATTSILNMHGGDTYIGTLGPVTYEGDTIIVDLANIFVVDDVTIINNGNLKILADHESADINSWDDGVGDFTANASITATGSGSITLAGANVYLNATDTVSSDTGNIDIIAYNASAGNHSAAIEVWGPITSNSGNIHLTATNTVTRDIETDEYDDWSSSNYAYIGVYDTEITSNTGNLSLSATNTVNSTIDGYMDEGYYDYSENYAQIYVEGDGTISTTGNISLSATNTVTRNINSDYIDDFEDYSENYALIDIQDTLTTTPDGQASSGAINITATNTVNNTLNSDYVEEFYDDSYNYAEVDVYGSDTISTDNGNIDINANSTGSGWHEAYVYIYAPVNSDSGNINIIADAGDYSIIEIYDTVSTVSGDINMIADDYVIDGDTIISESGDITLANATAGRKIVLGYTTPDDPDDWELDETFFDVILTGGTIFVGSDTAGSITVGTWDFGGRNFGMISGDAITDLSEGLTLIADSLSLTAAAGIGSFDNPLNTQVNTLYAYTTADGANIYIDEFDGIGIAELISASEAVITANGSSTLGSITTGGDFSFTTSAGAITVLPGTVSSGGGITLITLGGSIIAIGPGPHLIAAADSLLEASGVIASLPAPFDVLLTGGDLSVIIGSAFGGISGVFTGSTPSGTIVHNSPAGIIYFNGIQIWPPLEEGLSGYDLAQYAHSLVWRFLLPYLEQLAGYQINTFSGSVYLYHPLTETDISAFEEFILEEGAYEFIEGAINIIGHEGLLPLLEEIRRRRGAGTGP